MIKLQVEEYCHDCPEFEAESEELYYMNNGELEVSTFVSCMHKNKCYRIKNYIERSCKKWPKSY